MIGTYKEIAEYLGIKEESVKNYTCSRYKKLGGNNHYIFVNLGPAWKKKGGKVKWVALRSLKIVLVERLENALNVLYLIDSIYVWK